MAGGGTLFPARIRAARAAAAALGRTLAAERGVSEGGVRARVGVMARHSEAAAWRQQAQRGSSAASCGRRNEGRRSSALPCSALRPGSREAGGGRKEGERESRERKREKSES